jgi:hypothetical protein
VKISDKVYAYDFVLTVFFPGEEDSYEEVFAQLGIQANNVLNSSIQVMMDNEKVPVQFVVQKVDTDQTALLSHKGLLLRKLTDNGSVNTVKGTITLNGNKLERA